MRYFLCMLLLLVVLEVVVEARRWKGKPDVCRYMFVNPRIAFKQCSAACWRHKNCWGYCDLKHGRKQCICGDCERACSPPPTRQPATSPTAPTEQPATSPSAPTQPKTIYVEADLPHDPSQITAYLDHLQQMMKKLEIAYEATDVFLDILDGRPTIVAMMPEVECKKVPAMIEELKKNFHKTSYLTMPCRS
ncbi:unnamed protein product [Cylicocyclus nassatus]|uniref:Uncharacterized protein n=1 Tax=Cylicocyclus nassatus TaxID=53992 RepID=A0AA36HFG6_CYLNA|nr:unnamed protein product [Cylicocyclus nassatus]